jgi:hypothetical protein
VPAERVLGKGTFEEEKHPRRKDGKFGSGGGAGSGLSKADYDEAWEKRFDDTVDDDDFGGLSAYVRGDAGPMNNALRGERDVTPKLAESIGALDRYFDKYPTKTDTPLTVQRGIFETPTFDPSTAFHEGEVFVEPGWMSTTIDPETADKFSGGWQYEVTLPAGASYVHGAQHQSELILPRNSRFTVGAVDTDAKRVRLILEV